MRTYSTEQIRNIVLLSHGGAGKTSLSEAMLFSSGAISRLGKVNEGTTTSDFDPEEARRQISINLSLLPCEWKGRKVNVVDTPGYADFVGDVLAALRACDAALVLVGASSGVEVGTEQTWQYADNASLPRMVFISKMDRENADFFRTLEQVQGTLGKKCAPVQMPIGAESTFDGVIDLVSMRAYTGTAGQEGEVPAGLLQQARSLRDKLIEAVAELKDELITKYLDGQELTQDEIYSALKDGTKSGKIVPVLAGSGLQNKGITRLLDAIVELCPSPRERGPVKARSASGKDEVEVVPDPTAPLAALIFKTTADPYVGKLTYFRVFSGIMQSNSQVWNASKGAEERIGQLFAVRGKAQEAVPQVPAGDIGAVAKLSVTATGDTFTSREKPVLLPPIEFPAPALSMAVRPKTKVDLDKMSAALPRLVEEDPSMKVRRDPDTNETVVSGLGETHLEVAAEKLQRKFGAGVSLDVPKVPYRETISVPTRSEYKHKKQTGGHGQYGHVVFQVEPKERGGGFEFAAAVVGGSVPRNFIPAVEKGVNEGKQEGVMGGFPVVDVKVTLVDGSYHDVDSSEIAFKIASAQALKKGLSDGRPVLLEPIVNLQVTIPEEFTGDVISDLNTKRARVQGMNRDGKMTVIEGQVPQAEVLRYAVDLKSITQGRGTFTVDFSHYEEVPSFVAQKIVAEKQKQLEKV